MIEEIYDMIIESTFLIAKTTNYEILSESIQTILLIFSVVFLITLILTVIAMTIYQLYMFIRFLKLTYISFRKITNKYGYYYKNELVVFKIKGTDISECDKKALEYVEEKNIDYYFEIIMG